MSNVVLIPSGLLALVVGAELLVRGSCRLATFFGISPLIVGLTIVAFGTSAPELAVSVASTMNDQADIALGNVVGSNIFNVLLILGLSALITPLVVNQKLVRFDVPFMIGVSIAVWGMGFDCLIDRVEGTILLIGLLAYIAWCGAVGRRESAAIRQQYDEACRSEHAGFHTGSNGTTMWRNFFWQLSLVAGGLVLLVLGARWLVDGATVLARHFGISELVIGLTIVAGGTSLPELATSIVAAIRGERDIAVGNVVGSNIFNILGVLGLSAAVAPRGVTVAQQALEFDLPVMVAAAAACLPVFFTSHVIARPEGALFFGYAMAYTIALGMLATRSDALPHFERVMFGFLIPLTLIAQIVVFGRSMIRWRHRRIECRAEPRRG